MKPNPDIRTGALVGALLTAPLIAIFYLASQGSGLPFVPFDLLDWITRSLPGDMLTFGIERIVAVVTSLNLGDTSSTAKSIEHLLIIVAFWLLGVLLTAALFAFLRSRDGKHSVLSGLILGFIIGLIMLAVSAQVNQTATADPVFGHIWIVGAFIIWGLLLGRIYAALNRSYLSIPEERGVEETSPVFKSPPYEMGRGFRGGDAAVQQLNRRQFLIRLGGASAIITVAGAALSNIGREETEVALAPASPAWSDTNVLPNANASLQPASGTRPELTPGADHYTVDINANPPRVNEEDWLLEIGGLVRNPLSLTLNDLRNNYEPLHQFITLSCISNPVGGDLIGTQRWTGASLQPILREAVTLEGASYLKFTSADGFHEVVSRTAIVGDARIMLTYAWDDLPLTTEHGFPLRLYIPDVYGMKQPKWITGIEVIDHFDEGYWVRRGWDEVAVVRPTSVVDTVAVDSLVQDGDQTLVPIGGIAYAGKRGIRKVEVQVDDGEWVEAQLRDPISDLTWVIWRYDWPFQSGEHKFSVRCMDGRGAPQTEMYQNIHPSGATGIHYTRETL
jgi:DMSO/TMAO reductase YedYZ molybdopterin-dependent catalytic subunit